MSSLFDFGVKALAVLGVIGTLVAAIAASGFGIFRWFGTKWLDAKFSERLETFRHHQQRELEKLRFEIEALLDRTLKLHQREFEILPEIWSRLTLAYGVAVNFLAPFQQYPDLDNMGEAQLLEFLGASQLAEWQKVELQQGREKTSRYVNFIVWHDLNRSIEAYRNFHNYLVANGIFLPPDLKRQFLMMSEMISDAIRERQIAEQGVTNRVEAFAKAGRLNSEGGELLKSIEATVQSRLWNQKDIS